MLNSKDRLGAQDFGGYPSIKGHEFFETVDFESLYLRMPPRPSNFTEDAVDSTSEADDFTADAEPGLGGQQLSRLLGLQLRDEPSADTTNNSSSSSGSSASLPPAVPTKETAPSNNAQVTNKSSRTVVQFPANEQQLQARLLDQQKTIPQWHNLVDKKLILKQGLVDKRKV